MDRKVFATQNEVAATLGYTRQTIAKWREDGTLGEAFGLYPIYPAGKRVRFSRKALERVAAEQGTDPVPPAAAAPAA